VLKSLHGRKDIVLDSFHNKGFLPPSEKCMLLKKTHPADRRWNGRRWNGCRRVRALPLLPSQPPPPSPSVAQHNKHSVRLLVANPLHNVGL
jgi:hypothetical protein